MQPGRWRRWSSMGIRRGCRLQRRDEVTFVLFCRLTNLITILIVNADLAGNEDGLKPRTCFMSEPTQIGLVLRVLSCANPPALRRYRATCHS